MGAMSLAFVFACVAVTAAAYLLAAALSFALMYRIGPRFPSRAAGIVFAPLEWLAGHSAIFARANNWLCVKFYRLLVGGPIHGGWPPPPPRL